MSSISKEITIKESDLKSFKLKLKGKPTTEYCDACRRNSRGTQRFQFAVWGRQDLCIACRRKVEKKLSTYAKFDNGEIFADLQKKHEARVRKAEAAMDKAQQSLEAKAKPYVDVGLPEVFALACARSPEASDSILDLWEATWWKQYEPEDPMITSVLNGQFTEEEARWMDTFRSDHRDLVWALLNGSVSPEWARALLDSGFNTNIEAVSASLGGGLPKVIARIAKITVDTEMIPPRLDAPADTSEPIVETKMVEEPSLPDCPDSAIISWNTGWRNDIRNKTKASVNRYLKRIGSAENRDDPHSKLIEILIAFREIVEEEKEGRKLTIGDKHGLLLLKFPGSQTATKRRHVRVATEKLEKFLNTRDPSTLIP